MNQEPEEFWIVLQRPGQPDQTFALGQDEIRFGRDPSNNDLALDDLQVSRQHGRFIRRPDGYTLEDLGSTNGTILNGNKLAPNQPCLLYDGDTINLSDGLTVIYRARRVEVSPPVVPPPEPAPLGLQSAAPAYIPPAPAPTPAVTLPPGSRPADSGPVQVEAAPTGRSSRLAWILALAGCALVALCLAALAVFVIVARQRGLF